MFGSLGLGISALGHSNQVPRRFTPARLFAASEAGVWYDPSDLTTLYQDTAGTTPVTAAGQTVALMLDKSRVQTFPRRVNITTYSADLSQSVWGKVSTTVNSITEPAPTGPSTANRLTFSGVAGCRVQREFANVLTTGQSYTWSGYFRMTSGTGTFRFGVLRNGWGDVVFQTVTLDTTWQPISVTFTAMNPSCWVIIGNDLSSTFAGQVDSWGLQLEPGTAATAYQETSASFPTAWTGTHATQATAAARPTYQIDAGGRPYLSFDGVDDFMSTAAINFTATDKMTVFGGVRKVGTAAGMIIEASTDAGNTGGAFLLSANGGTGASYGVVSRGSLLAGGDVVTYAAPITNLLTADMAISTDRLIYRINAQQVASYGADQGTGTYGNHALYVGRRAGTSLPFSGNIFGLIVRGAATDAGTITSTETWLNGKTGAY